jgi:hypothetical protein
MAYEGLLFKTLAWAGDTNGTSWYAWLEVYTKLKCSSKGEDCGAAALKELRRVTHMMVWGESWPLGLADLPQA